MMPDLQSRTLAALSESILPSDDGPGAAEAGVVAYIEQVLSALSPQAQQRISGGLDLVESLAVQMHGKSFAECSSEQRGEVLSRLQRIPHPLARGFLATLVDLTLEGFFCDPLYGGNRDATGWRYIGYQPRGPFSA